MKTQLKKCPIAGALLASVLVFSSNASCHFADVANSHIDGNVPQGAEFDAILRRDLRSYFAGALGKDVVVEYELLRHGPTQSGVSFPKFYFWVRARSAAGERSGAARVAAVQRTSFEVTDFVARDEAIARPDRLRTIFPASVAERIDARASGR